MQKSPLITTFTQMVYTLLIVSIGACPFPPVSAFIYTILPESSSADINQSISKNAITEHTSTKFHNSNESEHSLPVILELSIWSNNNCNTSYAIDEDQITCTFTTASPCALPATTTVTALSSFPTTGSPAHSSSNALPSTYTGPDVFQISLTNPTQDYQHWFCTFSITSGIFADQSILTGQLILDWIFQEGYQYCGNNPSITYFAPIEFSYVLRTTNSPAPMPQFSGSQPSLALSSTSQSSDLQFSLAQSTALRSSGLQPSLSLFSMPQSYDSRLSPLQSSIPQPSSPLRVLEITSNHPIQFLTPEQFTNETGSSWSVSIIDAAGNGPVCITIPLEDGDILLYNLR